MRNIDYTAITNISYNIFVSSASYKHIAHTHSHMQCAAGSGVHLSLI